MTQALDLVMKRQLSWATRHGLAADGKGYLPTFEANLFATLSMPTAAEFAAAAGNETTDRPGEPAKMRALHSSSALVCNVFDSWRRLDPGAVARALRLPVATIRLRFEAQLPTGLRGTPPTLDLLLEASDALAWGVESKFTEPYQSGMRGEPFVGSYFDAEAGLWARRGLPRCQRLAEDLRDRRATFRHLDAAQLLKHALGIRHRYPVGRLLFLWFDVDAPEGRVLAVEIRVFADAVDEALGFRAMTHQEVFSRLAAEPLVDAAYVEYLRTRYFSD